jgi:hypothetical protein
MTELNLDEETDNYRDRNLFNDITKFLLLIIISSDMRNFNIIYFAFHLT